MQKSKINPVRNFVAEISFRTRLLRRLQMDVSNGVKIIIQNAKIFKLLFIVFIFSFLVFNLSKALAQSSGVDLLWEANTYTPYYYKGKSLITPLSEVKISALTNFVVGNKQLSANDMNFDWFLNDSFVAKKSGAGKNYFKFQTSVLSSRKSVIKLEVSDLNKTFQKTASIAFPSQNPEILIYKYNPLNKEMSQKTISNIESLSGETIQFIAEPYFMPMESFEGAVFDWELNGKTITDEGLRNILTFESLPGTVISAFISVRVFFNSLLEDIKNSFVVNVI